MYDDMLDRAYQEGHDWGVVKGIFYCLAVEAFSYVALQFVLWGLGV